jgi:two-component system NtrC family sensor kinase
MSIRLNVIEFAQLDGRNGYLGVTLNPVVGEDTEQLGILLLGLDITELKVLEMQLGQAQKLEAIGQLAAGIAHEINTPIQYIGDNTRFLQDSFASMSSLLESYHCLLKATKSKSVRPEMVAEVDSAIDEADMEYLSEEIPLALQQSLEGVSRVAEIVRAMREFSHPGTEEKKAIDINRAIESTITVARNEWKYVAEMETDLDTDLPRVLCLPGEFNQAILNLLVNAAHAIVDVVGDGAGAKGRITVSTRRDGDWAEIRISDTGTGIPEEVRPRIFEPFFTTKDVGEGTGQGLAIAYNVVVEKHNGTITFETEVGKGTTFIIRLPISPTPKMETVDAG